MNNLYCDIKLASNGKRFGAFLIDSFIQCIMIYINFRIAYSILIDPTTHILVRMFDSFLFFCILFSLLTIFISFIIPIFIWNGQTIGKRILNIKVVSNNGQELEKVKLLGRILIFNLSSSMFYGIPLIISGVLILSNENKETLHDKILNTIVIDIN